ncbi:MAG: folate hydrolase, partial [Acidobacteriota bacterium]|nr:folate hydrolase [Acidobacteriota bacterium]
SPNPRPSTLDLALYKTERALTSETGLPGRDWFRHQIYAPGFYTGYGVKTLPAVREAIEQRDWDLAGKKIEFVANIIENFASEIDRAAQLRTDNK